MAVTISALCVANNPRTFEISNMRSSAVAFPSDVTSYYNGESVPEFILSILAVIRVFFRSRRDTALEILALRQQLAVLKRKRPRPPLRSLDRLFWTLLRRSWSRWAEVLVIVKPSTVVGWHRTGFRLYSLALSPARW